MSTRGPRSGHPEENAIVNEKLVSSPGCLNRRLSMAGIKESRLVTKGCQYIVKTVPQMVKNTFPGDKEVIRQSFT